MKKYIISLFFALLAISTVGARPVVDDDDTKAAPQQREIRRLHPSRERARAIKRLQEQMSRKADPNADPWDTDDDMWGLVDRPRYAAGDSTAVEGRLITMDDDATPRRLLWRDEPVTATIDQLEPYVTIDANGECRSKYVSPGTSSNEVYFAFTLNDSIAGPLRLCVQYCSSLPLHYDLVVFTIDGYDYQFYPSETHLTRLEDGQWVERSDDVLREGYKDLVYALAHGSWVVMKLGGADGRNPVKMLTDGQREDFAKTFSLYRLLGGGW